MSIGLIRDDHCSSSARSAASLSRKGPGLGVARLFKWPTSWSHHLNRKDCTISAANSERCRCVENPNMCGLRCSSAKWQAWRTVPLLTSGFFFGAGTNNNDHVPGSPPRASRAWRRRATYGPGMPRRIAVSMQGESYSRINLITISSGTEIRRRSSSLSDWTRRSKRWR